MPSNLFPGLYGTSVASGPAFVWRHRARSFSVAALISLIVMCMACGEEDDWKAFDISYMATQDCAQVGANAVQCEDEEALAKIVNRGRWVYDYSGGDTLTLLTEDGRFLPGIFFTNDGRLTTVACLGGGGTCHFARSRTESREPTTGCIRIIERRVDVVVENDELSGEIVEETMNDESCGTANIRQQIFQVSGARVAEVVLAREEVKP